MICPLSSILLKKMSLYIFKFSDAFCCVISLLKGAPFWHNEHVGIISQRKRSRSSVKYRVKQSESVMDLMGTSVMLAIKGCTILIAHCWAPWIAGYSVAMIDHRIGPAYVICFTVFYFQFCH